MSAARTIPPKDAEPAFAHLSYDADACSRLAIEPLLSIEKKLIACSFGTGLFLLLALTLISRL